VVDQRAATAIAAAANATSGSGRMQRKGSRRAGVKCSYLRHNKAWPTANLTCLQCERSVCSRCMEANPKWAIGTDPICGEFPNCNTSALAGAASAARPPTGGVTEMAL